MKKHTYICGFTALALLASLAACSDIQDTVTPLPSKTYTGVNALHINYNDAPMSGKTVMFSQTDNSGSLTATPDVLPGSPSITLPVYLTPDGNRYVFSGSGETEYVSYAYSGSVDASTLTLNLSDVLLKDQRLANTVWTPAPAVKGSTPFSYTSFPFHVVWECDLPFPLEGLDASPQDLLQLLATLPIIPVYSNTAYMTPVQAFTSMIKTFALRPDGNAVVTYLQKNNGAATYAQAPLCMLQYVPEGDDMLRLFVNVTDLEGQILINTSSHPELPANPFGAASRAADNQGAVAAGSDEQAGGETAGSGLDTTALLKQMEAMLAQGIPMHYELSGNTLSVYAGSEVLLPLLKGVIVPMLEEPAVQQALMARIAANESLAPYASQLKPLLAALPQLLTATSRLELGLNLTRASN